MASSRKSKRADSSAPLVDKVAQRIAACAAFVVSGEGGVPTVAVALSGGRDSAALLHACAAWRDAGVRVRLVALHIHHGLQADADAWESACARMAQAAGVEFHAPCECCRRSGAGRGRGGARGPLYRIGRPVCADRCDDSAHCTSPGRSGRDCLAATDAWRRSRRPFSHAGEPRWRCDVAASMAGCATR